MRSFKLIFVVVAIAIAGVILASPPTPGWQTVLTSSSLSQSTKQSVMDAQGNIFIASSVQNSNSSTTVYVSKLDPYGDVQWIRSYSGTFLVSINGMAVDNLGDVFVQITKYPAASDEDEVDLYGLNPAGTRYLSKTAECVNGGGLGIAVDSKNNICEAMDSQQAVSPYSEEFIEDVYSPTGGLLHAKTDAEIAPTACTFDQAGTCCVTGGTPGIGGNAVFCRYTSPTLDRVTFKTTTGGLAGSQTTSCVDYVSPDAQTPGAYFLATTKEVQANNAITYSSQIAFCRSDDSVIWTSPDEPIGVYYIVNNGPKNVQAFGFNNGSSGGTTYLCVNNGMVQFSTNGYNYLAVAPEANGHTYVAEGSGNDVNIQELDNHANTVGQIQTVTTPGTNPAAGCKLTLEQVPAFTNALTLLYICDQCTHGSTYAPTVGVDRGGVVFDSCAITNSATKIPSGSDFSFVLGATAVATDPISVSLEGIGGVTFDSSTVTIPAGKQFITVTGHTTPTATDETIEVIAKGSGVRRSDHATEKNPSITDAVVPGTASRTGGIVTVTINLDGKAPAGGTPITVTSSDQTVIKNTTITIDEGLAQGDTFLSIESFKGTVDKTVTLTFTDPNGNKITKTVVVKAD